MKTAFGAALILVSMLGFEWGARILFQNGWDANGQATSQQGVQVGGLVLAYGLGLAPMVVGMLLLEAAYDYRRRWASILALMPSFYAVTLWGALSRQLHVIHDKAFVPSVLLLIGVIGITGWATSLWIRLRRAALAEYAAARKKVVMEAAKKEMAAEKAVREEAARKAQEKHGEPKAAEQSAEDRAGGEASQQAR